MERTLQGQAVQEEHDVQVADLPFEFMMNALRLVEGFPLRLFDERTGVPGAAVLKQLERAESLGLIRRDHERIAPTLRGQRFLNELLQLFLPL
jgi:oxygen-independent coproporphyrinogen-3 oxidase